MKERYWSTVQVKDWSGVKVKEYEIFCNKSAEPTVGDFISTFQAEGLTAELRELRPLTFRASKGDSTLILVVLRTMKDQTYKNK